MSRKQFLALREFALGIERLEHFISKEPLRRIDERVFGVLALESEDIDPYYEHLSIRFRSVLKWFENCPVRTTKYRGP